MNTQTTFYHILGNNLLAGITNNLVWLALTFWVYIETQSVLATSWIAGTFAIAGILGGFIFGPIVDRERKRLLLCNRAYYRSSPTVLVDSFIFLILRRPGKIHFHPFSGY